MSKRIHNPQQGCPYKNCRGLENGCERYDHDPALISLALSLEGAVIRKAQVGEKESGAYVDMLLKDGRLIRIGVSGNLHDEAYLVFEKAEIP